MLSLSEKPNHSLGSVHGSPGQLPCWGAVEAGQEAGVEELPGGRLLPPRAPRPLESAAVVPCARGEASCSGAAQDVARRGKGRMLFIRGTLNKQVGLWLWGELSQARGLAAWSTVPCANLQTPRCPKISLFARH